MTPYPDLVAEAPKSRPDAPRFDMQAQADAVDGSREVALHDRETEVATKEETVCDERVGYSGPSLLESTPVLIQHGAEKPEMNVNGNHMLLALVVAVCLAGPLAWAFVRYWLFAP